MRGSSSRWSICRPPWMTLFVHPQEVTSALVCERVAQASVCHGEVPRGMGSRVEMLVELLICRRVDDTMVPVDVVSEVRPALVTPVFSLA